MVLMSERIIAFSVQLTASANRYRVDYWLRGSSVESRCIYDLGLQEIFIVMDNGNGPPARIEISENKDGKLLSQLEWPKRANISAHAKIFTSWNLLPLACGVIS